MFGQGIRMNVVGHRFGAAGRMVSDEGRAIVFDTDGQRIDDVAVMPIIAARPRAMNSRCHSLDIPTFKRTAGCVEFVECELC